MAESIIYAALAQLQRGESLTRDDAFTVFEELMQGHYAPEQIGALLMGLSIKGETSAEIEGAAAAMRRACIHVPVQRTQLLDTCGTGGSGISRKNVSTAVAIVAAACGVSVAKHGNRAASSKSGSADVLEALGVNINASPKQVARCVDELGVGFLFARALHPAMRHAGPVRQALRIRTIFNLLGPLTNPAGAKRQCMGVYDPTRCETLARALGALGSERVMILHGWLDANKSRPGIDDLSLSGPSTVAHWYNNQCELIELMPRDAGVESHSVDALSGGSPAENAASLRALLAGETGAYRDAVVYATALALLTASEDAWETLPTKADRARQAIDSGRAQEILDGLIGLSHEAAAEAME